VLALWGVVLSTVYMLRAYRKTFMGSILEQWSKLPDLKPGLRVPVALLVTALLWCGFFPQSLVRSVAPTFGSFLSANTDVQICSHGALRRLQTVAPRPEHAPHGRGYSTGEIARK
jgi:NADH:ubiquinone oxidoreductase subunit 4 (subunit M)